MSTMKWTRDGDQHVAHGIIGDYYITEWMQSGGSTFPVACKLKRTASKKGIGEFSSLANAKLAAVTYDEQRRS
jgi:hypothetical protein